MYYQCIKKNTGNIKEEDKYIQTKDLILDRELIQIIEDSIKKTIINVF